MAAKKEKESGEGKGKIVRGREEGMEGERERET